MQPDRASERGMALVIVMFMVLITSVLGASLVFVSNTETLSSRSYQTATQTRYSAESGISAAANYLLTDYANRGADPLTAYDTTKSPVELKANPGQAVVLSSNAAIASNYPVLKAKDDFLASTAGQLAVGGGSAGYTASATLLSMRQITDAFTGNLVTLQTWRIVGTGTVPGVGGGAVEVTAVLETEAKSVFNYGLFATGDECGAITLNGDIETDSYDSRDPSNPQWQNTDGDLGTNGNLTQNGNAAVVNGSLSTPRTGVGKCSGGGITGATGNNLNITEGITQLPQPLTFPTPPTPNPLPPSTKFDIKNDVTLEPPAGTDTLVLGDVVVSGQAKVHVKPGIYVVNSISLGSQTEFITDGPGKVIIKVAGVGQSTPIDFSAGTVVNPTHDPTMLQFMYGGEGTIKMSGGPEVSAMIVAPNAAVEWAGGGDFYGAMIVKTMNVKGTFEMHYDRALGKLNVAQTPGNPVLQQFSWSNY